MLRPGLFAPESFDLIALFQTFDHLSQPAAALHEFHRLLRPNGRILFLQHNVRAFSARILGERSPIIDIGHTYLYDPNTLDSLVRLHGFETVERGRVWNRYSLRYLVSLLPLRPRSKQSLRSLVTKLGLDRLNVSVPLGNMYLVARKLE
jgi:SAM-dependent methyltransferase